MEEGRELVGASSDRSSRLITLTLGRGGQSSRIRPAICCQGLPRFWAAAARRRRRLPLSEQAREVWVRCRGPGWIRVLLAESRWATYTIVPLGAGASSFGWHRRGLHVGWRVGAGVVRRCQVRRRPSLMLVQCEDGAQLLQPENHTVGSQGGALGQTQAKA